MVSSCKENDVKCKTDSFFWIGVNCRIPYDFAHILCKRTAWDIRKELIPIFGPQFPLEALAPDHPDYGCLLLDPKNISTNKASQQKRMRTTKRETIKQQHRQQQQRPVRRTKPKPMRSSSGRHSKIASSMSVTRLLNEQSDEEMSDDSGSQESIDSPQSTPSPSFRVIQTFPPEDSLILPPINNEYWSPPPIMDRSLTPVAQDIIDTISATILLQRLSQDDGARPFRPLESSTIPSKVIVGHQEFTICWE